jgi:hypothetical protein
MTHDHTIEIQDKYIWLSISDTKSEMIQQAITLGVTDLTDETLGAFVPVIEDDKIGIIYINLEHANMPIIAHECGHAAFELLRKTGIAPIELSDSPNGYVEETFLHVQSNIFAVTIDMLNQYIVT